MHRCNAGNILLYQKNRQHMTTTTNSTSLLQLVKDKAVEYTTQAWHYASTTYLRCNGHCFIHNIPRYALIQYARGKNGHRHKRCIFKWLETLDIAIFGLLEFGIRWIDHGHVHMLTCPDAHVAILRASDDVVAIVWEGCFGLKMGGNILTKLPFGQMKLGTTRAYERILYI